MRNRLLALFLITLYAALCIGCAVDFATKDGIKLKFGFTPTTEEVVELARGFSK